MLGVFYHNKKLYWQEKYFLKKVLLFIVKGLVLRALFEMAEVTLSRVYVLFGFHCIIVKVPSHVKVSGFRWKTQHIKSELLCKQKTRFHSSSIEGPRIL